MVNSDIQLSKNFTLKELISSRRYPRLVEDKVPALYFENLKKLVTYILQPLRDFLGEPVVINSGYRNKRLNRAVGGSYRSAHLYGRAADIRVHSEEEGRVMMDFLSFNKHVHKALFEHRRDGALWIHVEYSGKPAHYLNYDFRV